MTTYQWLDSEDAAALLGLKKRQFVEGTQMLHVKQLLVMFLP